MKNGATMQGIIRIYKSQGFGFIIVPNERQVYFHISAWLHEEEPLPGDRVSFDLVRCNRKPGFPDEASNVVRIEPGKEAINSLATPVGGQIGDKAAV
jgi:cold shock CspA family protein